MKALLTSKTCNFLGKCIKILKKYRKVQKVKSIWRIQKFLMSSLNKKSCNNLYYFYRFSTIISFQFHFNSIGPIARWKSNRLVNKRSWGQVLFGKIKDNFMEIERYILEINVFSSNFGIFPGIPHTFIQPIRISNWYLQQVDTAFFIEKSARAIERGVCWRALAFFAKNWFLSLL